MNYYNKYIKYKIKYFKLKKALFAQTGGVTPFYISGPVSFHIIKIPKDVLNVDKDVIIYLFGDVHVDNKRICEGSYEKCKQIDDCFSVNDYIEKMIDANIKQNEINRTENYIDLFLEAITPYPSRKGTDKFKYDAYLEKYYGSIGGPFGTMEPEIFRRIVTYMSDQMGKYDPVVMKMASIYKNKVPNNTPLSNEIADATVKLFDADSDAEHKKIYAKAEKLVAAERASEPSQLIKLTENYDNCIFNKINCPRFTRIHAVDFRHDTIIIPYYDMVKTLYQIFITHKSLYDEKYDLKKSTMFIKKIFLPNNDPKQVMNIYKIFDKLDKLFKPDENISIINVFDNIIDKEGAKLNKQLENMTPKLYIHLSHFKNFYLNKLKENYRITVANIKYINKLLEDDNNEFFKLFVNGKFDYKIINEYNTVKTKLLQISTTLLYLGAIIMDLYTLGRMFRKFKDCTYPRKIIIYAGNAHIKKYLNFIIGNDQLNGIKHEILFKQEIQIYNNEENKCMIIPIDSDKLLHFMKKKIWDVTSNKYIFIDNS